LARQRTLIVGTLRHADVEVANPRLKRGAADLLARGSARELTLGALTEEDLAAYLEARFPGHRFPPALAAALHARTEGLALLMRSLVDILLERRDLHRGDQGWSLARPVEELNLESSKGLLDLVRQQMDGLPSSEREILEAASVAGREFLSCVIADLVGREVRQVEEDLRRLDRVRRLIVHAGEETLPEGTLATRYRFSHAFYLSCLLEDLVPSRRLELHRVAAGRLAHYWGTEAPRIATEIARHCEEGHDYDGAIGFRGHAGDNAARLFAYAEAEEHYEWAFRWFEKLPAERRPAAAISLHRRRGTVRLAQARFDDATADFRSLLTVARATGAEAAERTALAGLCDTLFFEQKVEEVAAHAQELLKVATRAGTGADVDEARARIAQELVCEGRLAEAIPMLDETIASARRHGLRGALKLGLVNRGLARYWQTEYESAEVACLEAASIATEAGDGFYALAARMFAGLSRANLGRVSEALDDFADTIAIARRNGDRYWLPRLLSHVGWLHRELGDFDRAREHDLEALQVARERPMPWAAESEALLNLSLDDLRLGETKRAADLLRELQAKTAESAWFRWMNELRLEAVSADHWAERGDHSRAGAHAARLVELAERFGAPNFVATAERIRGQLALDRNEGVAEASVRLARALAALTDRPAPLEAWKSGRVLALLRQRQSDDAGAQAAFREAAQAVGTIAAGTRDPRLRAGFLATPSVREVLGQAGGSEVER
jgi:tetratricopeptide (TPR) repeat protein